jgi:hypothetical protein
MVERRTGRDLRLGIPPSFIIASAEPAHQHELGKRAMVLRGTLQFGHAKRIHQAKERSTKHRNPNPHAICAIDCQANRSFDYVLCTSRRWTVSNG